MWCVCGVHVRIAETVVRKADILRKGRHRSQVRNSQKHDQEAERLRHEHECKVTSHLSAPHDAWFALAYLNDLDVYPTMHDARFASGYEICSPLNSRWRAKPRLVRALVPCCDHA